ncbi:TetR family transcriptional regulator [Streptomyces beijiangensis]|uniref:TetR family transcriptional regulator n=1 Tax=Streptomyces beijiangensis TaxID=163361 RepID=A0A939F280_9ACTN|nr:TetR family transcriptional regulator [Streptomyces beijiangensis]MBO0510787.1 TetR family transcriptional regulator [Streptomyces beijiangensis]
MSVRDPEATKARIFEAATAEFAAYGIAGARVDRIAREAKANKQLIYAYFGNKAELFAQVLEKALVDIAVSTPVDAENIDDWIDRLLDYHAAHPHVLRLLFWEGLEYGTDGIPHEEERRTHYDRKTAAFATAQAKGVISDAIPPQDLLFMMVALAGWSTAVPQMRRILVGGTDDDGARLRSSIREAARRLTQQ